MRYQLKQCLALAAIAGWCVVTSTAHADLIGYWPFEDGSGTTVEDLSGNGFDATASDAFEFADDGFIGAAGNFGDFNNGAFVLLPEEFATGPNGFEKIVASQNFTISLWLNRQKDASDSQWTMLFGGSRQIGSHAAWGDGNIYFDVAGCCGGNQRISTSMNGADTDSEWHHLAYVKRKETGAEFAATAIYLDGAVIQSSAGWADGDPVISDVVSIDAASIGADNGGGSSQAGLIDEFAIWDEALDEGRIVALSEGAPILGDKVYDFNEDGVVDVADFDILATNFGEKFAFGQSQTMGDVNGDLRVNLKDFLEFRTFYNTPAGAPSGSRALLDGSVRPGDLWTVRVTAASSLTKPRPW